MYVIVVGAGHIGSAVVKVATEAGHEVVVIERDEQTARDIQETYDARVINDDGAKRDIFREAHPGEADAVIAATDNDATNLMLMMFARDFEVPSRVSVVHELDCTKFFEEVDAHVMANPQQLIADYLVDAIEGDSR